MRTVVCKGCGKIVRLSGERYLCDACAKKARQTSVIRVRTCKVCGVQFPGGPSAAYCPECRRLRERERKKEYARRRAAGTVRKIGSMDICTRCGAEYKVEAGPQTYCPACAEIGVKEQVRPKKREYNAQRRTEIAAAKARAKADRKVCVVCGKVFNGRPAFVTCSDECAAIHRKRKQAENDAKRRETKRREHSNET